MNSLSFSWNSGKNSLNQRKHGIRFEEAQTVFFDENAIEYYDPEHSIDEHRFLMLGVSYRLRILVVSYCVIGNEDEFRIISARKATKNEQKEYIGGRR